MLTTTHIVTMLTVGVLVSAGLFVVTEFATRPMKDAARAKWWRRWFPVFLGMFLGSFGFPATFSVVVAPIEPAAWYEWAGWLAGGLFAGLVGGAGAKVANDVAKTVLEKVKSE